MASKSIQVQGTALANVPEGQRALYAQIVGEAQADFLLQRTPPQEIKTRPGKGGKQFKYVDVGYVIERLNLVFGFNWDFEVTWREILADEAIVEGRLTVRTPTGQTITKTQYGGADIKKDRNQQVLSIADDLKGAASDALKKCASLLGVGLDVYGGDTADVQHPPVAEQTRLAPQLVEPNVKREQVTEIERLLPLAGVTAEEVMGSLDIGAWHDLTEARADRVIRRLGKIAEDRATPEPAGAH